MTRDQMLNSLRVQIALATGRSALTTSLLQAHVRALRHDGLPALREFVLSRLEGRTFTQDLEAPLLLAAAVHYQVLGPDRDQHLAAFFPSVGGRFSGTPAEEAALGRALNRAARDAPSDWGWYLSSGRLLPSEPLRALAWLLPARALQDLLPLPLDLVELGAGAGLLLVGDLVAGDSLLVRRRVGLDRAPLDVGDPLIRRCLRACVWPDQLDRMQRLDQALHHLLTLRREGLDPVLQSGEYAGTLPEAIRRLRAEAPGPRRLIIYSAVTTPDLDAVIDSVQDSGAVIDSGAPSLKEEAYYRLTMRVRDALTAWKDIGPALWLELEPRPGGALDRQLHLVAQRTHGAVMERIVLGRLPPYPSGAAEFQRHPGGWAALSEWATTSSLR